MNPQAIPYIIPLMISGTISIILAFYVSRMESSPKVQMFTLLMASVSIWSFAYLLELWSGELPAILFWKKVKYFGIVIVPVAWFAFCLHYTGKEKWVTNRNLLLLFIIPIFNLILLWSNQFHNLFYTHVELDYTAPITTAYVIEGAGFWFHFAYSYLLLLIGTLLILSMLVNTRHLYRKQTIAMLIGAITPFVGNAIYNFKLIILPIDYDLTPLFFVVTGIALTWSVFRFQFLDLVPIARDTIFENISDAIFVLDKQNRIIDFNQFAKNMFLKDDMYHLSKDMMGKTAEEVFSEIPSLSRKYKDNITCTQTEIEIDLEKMKKYYDARISPLYDKQGRIAGHIMILRDITERKKAYDTLQESEKRFQDVALSSADWIWEVDKDGRYAFASGKVKEILGYEPSELIGKTPFDLMPEDEAKRVGEIFKEITSEKKPIVDLENLNLSKQGEKVNLLTNGVPLLNESGELIGYRGVDKDITKRKRAEEELKDAHEILRTVNKELEKKVKERTVQVEKLVTQKDEFINQLGHDLKTPLTPLVALTPLLRKCVGDKPEVIKIVDTLVNSTNHMKNMVDKTLQLARLNSSKVEFEFEETNLVSEINDAIENNQYLLDENNMDVKNMVDEEIIVQADKSQLYAVFNNLFTNAIKYAQDNKGNIVIDAEKGKDDKVIVSVKDDGIGMTSEQKKFVFDEFYKVDSSRHDLESSGLGLAICTRIVEHHGGRIWVESSGPGRGCTFYFTLKTGGKKDEK